MAIATLETPGRNPPLRGSWAACLALSLVAAACGGTPPQSEQERAHGIELVAGSSLDRHGLLVVPREGGRPQLRSLANPSRVVWSGRTELPSPEEAHPFGRTLVLRDREATAYRYDPSRDALETLSDVPPEAKWIASGDGGLFLSREEIFIPGETGVRRLRPEGRVVWAAPAAAGRVIALAEVDGGVEATVWPAEGDDPEARRILAASGASLLTAWGRSLLIAPAGGELLAELTLPGLETGEGTDLGEEPGMLAASPSTHRVFATSTQKPKVLAIDRFRGRVRDLAKFPAPIVEIRPALLDDHLLAHDGESVWLVSPSGRRARVIACEWGPDLPLALPGGAVLGIAAGQLRMWSGGEEEADHAVEGPVEAWWIPIRWAPDRLGLQFASGEAPDIEAAAAEAEAEAVTAAASPARTIGLGTRAAVAGQTVSAPPRAPRDSRRGGLDPERRLRDPESGATSGSIAPGFYAVASSSRQEEGVRELSRALERSGYPARVVSRSDEAAEVWYRVMVGPYGTREAAEETAARLRSERGIQAWIRHIEPEEELGFGSRGGG